MMITELSNDARAVADLLASCQVGELVTYAAMSEAIGRNIKHYRHIIDAARRVAAREAGAVFAVERGDGYRRLEAAQVAPVLGSATRKHLRVTARRKIRTIRHGTDRANDLTPEDQRRVAAEISALGLIEHMARDQVARPADNGPTKPEPVAITARRFLSALTGTDAA
jgi:hypothetical protein